MHISDGIIQTQACIAAGIVTAGLLYYSGKRVDQDEIPKMGMAGAALFTASLLHFPLAGTSVHLGLFGLAGIVLGPRAFPVIFTALLFQSLLFQHGGLVTLGLNTLNMGAGAIAAWYIWKMRRIPEPVRAVIAGFFGIIVPAALMGVEFLLSGYGKGILYLLTIYSVPAAVEGGITLSAVKFFRTVKSDILVS